MMHSATTQSMTSVGTPTSMTAPMGTPIVEATNLAKQFGGVHALRSASFQLWPGEVVAILGANGAGKSTLLKILAGVFPPDEGTLSVRGREVQSYDVGTSRSLGIEMVYQDLGLVPNMDACYNLFLGRPIRKFGIFADRKAMLEKTRSVIDSLGVTTMQDPTKAVEGMSGGQRQVLAIGRAVTWGSGVVILDEPAAALGIAETEQVLKVIEDLKRQGTSILLVSHNLEHVFRVADRAVVMYQGRTMAAIDIASSSVGDLTRAITSGAL
jgi:ABC-type sugar transport system ATPase subunit